MKNFSAEFAFVFVEADVIQNALFPYFDFT